MIRVFIGYDGKETIAYHVLAHSILARASKPVSIAPLMLTQLKDSFHRERNALQSTDFAFSRFLVPYLCEYQGWSIFMDCDMLVLDDMENLWKLRDERYAVMCVKHDYTPKTGEKFLGQVQTTYEKKNWSSVMLFNNAKCKALTPEFVNTASGLELHRFKWLDGDHLIGEIPVRWNFLVGEYEKIPAEDISNLHYTLGGPYFNAYKDTDYADLWFSERERLLFADKDVRIISKNQPKQAQLSATDHFNLAFVAFEGGKREEARKICQELLANYPQYADGINLMGVLYHQAGELPPAREWFVKAVAADPQNPHYALNMAMVCQALGDVTGMKTALDSTLALSPGYAQAFQMRLQLALKEEEYATAERLIKNLMPIVPQTPDLLKLLITVLGKQSKYAETLPLYESLKDMQGTLDMDQLGGYGLALQYQGRLEDAIAQFEMAIAFGHESAEMQYNLGVALDHTAQHERAKAAFEKSLSLDPQYKDAINAQAMLTIKMKGPDDPSVFSLLVHVLSKEDARQYDIPAWEGQPLEGKRLLLSSEQGVGDIVMFAGFIPPLLAMGARITLEMYKPMIEWFTQSFPDVKVIPMTAALNTDIRKQDFDYHCMLGDLMRFGIGSYRPTEHAPHMKADTNLTASLRAKYKGASDQRLIGISWHTINPITGYIRSIPLDQWLPILRTPNCRFVSLQYMDHDADIAALASDQGVTIISDHGIDPVREKHRFAVQIAAMDEVISIQNAATHFAGALGVPTTLMLSAAADWRWGLTRSDNPFYRTVRIVRQTAYGRWQPVIEQVAGELAARAGAKKARHG